MKTSIITHAGIAFVVLAVLVGGYVYFLSETRHLQDRIQELTVEIAQKTGEYEEEGSMRDLLKETEVQEATLATHFVDPSDIVSFLEHLEGVGSGLGVFVTIVSVTDPDATGAVTVSLSLEGSFDAVMRTVGLIEHDVRATAVRTLALDVGENGSWNAALSVTALTPHTP